MTPFAICFCCSRYCCYDYCAAWYPDNGECTCPDHPEPRYPRNYPIPLPARPRTHLDSLALGRQPPGPSRGLARPVEAMPPKKKSKKRQRSPTPSPQPRPRSESVSPGGTRYTHAKRVKQDVAGHTDTPEGYALNVVRRG